MNESEPVEEQDELIEEADKVIDNILKSQNPEDTLFADNESLKTLALAKRRDRAWYSQAKSKLKGIVNLNDFEATLNRLGNISLVDTEASYLPDFPPLIERENAYFQQVTINGEPDIAKVSNFILQIEERLLLPDGEIALRVKVRFEDGQVMTVDLQHQHLLAKKDLQAAFKRPDTSFKGGDGNMQLLRAHLAKQDAPLVLGTETIGRFEYEEDCDSHAVRHLH